MDPVWIGVGATLLAAVVDGAVRVARQRRVGREGDKSPERTAEHFRVVAAEASLESAGHRLRFAVSLRTSGGEDGGRGAE
ncbi:hypothetical protein KBZ21_20340 [Streptomyces sp. A73]|uniref:hypothetical protein n=1 Tax=Streptomyces TaxID=1883 RepID=UPI000C1A306D|nr:MULTISPECIES: hypothetical protein [unclassified Streptomyces]MBQ0867669.1 hypothetical protein [Streptomyces sp. RK75]MBQ1120495.1 hypothetical protein [Streptomyces sp. B15]MBQ1160424.1 hypothetical protein [Streptomyces sp. A73]